MRELFRVLDRVDSVPLCIPVTEPILAFSPLLIQTGGGLGLEPVLDTA